MLSFVDIENMLERELLVFDWLQLKLIAIVIFVFFQSLALVKSFNICMEMDFSDLTLNLFKILFGVVRSATYSSNSEKPVHCSCPFVVVVVVVVVVLCDGVLKVTGETKSEIAENKI